MFFSYLLHPDSEVQAPQFVSLADKARNNIVIPSINLEFAENGEKLIQLLQACTEQPDILFLDLNMPMKNGFECLEAIRENKKLVALPVVIYTTTANPEQVKNTFHRGANLFWQKPSNYSSIKKMLHKILQVPRKLPSQEEKGSFYPEVVVENHLYFSA